MRTGGPSWPAVAVVALAAVGSVVAQHSYRSSSGQTRDYQYSYAGLPSANAKDVISIVATLLSVTPDTQEALVRLELTPQGTYADAEGQLRTPVTVLVRGTTGTSAYSFDAGQVMPPTDVTLDIVGQVTSYPFDTYRESGPSYFDIAVIKTGGSLRDLAARVPSVVSLGSYIGGWKVNVQVITPSDVQPGKYVQSFDVHIQRASATVFYVLFIMVLMWALALAGVAMALMLTLLHRSHRCRATHLPRGTALCVPAHSHPSTPGCAGSGDIDRLRGVLLDRGHRGGHARLPSRDVDHPRGPRRAAPHRTG